MIGTVRIHLQADPFDPENENYSQKSNVLLMLKTTETCRFDNLK